MTHWIAVLALLFGGALILPENLRRRAAILPLLSGVTVLTFQWSDPPGFKLLAASLFMLLLVKLTALWSRAGVRAGTWVIPYLFPWPGVDYAPFQQRVARGEYEAWRFAQGWRRMLFALVLFAVVVVYSPQLSDTVLAALSVTTLVVAIHLGLSYLLTSIYRLYGWNVDPAFDDPWRSRSLVELWSQRWNRPFVEMNRLLVLPWARRVFGKRAAWVSAFVVSGLLHEMAISYPAGAGFGLPLSYFLLQAALIGVERRYTVRGRMWTMLAVLLPLPLLFHAPFLQRVVAPLVRTLYHRVQDLITMVQPEHLVIALGALSLLPLVASLQVPAKLRWREEFGKLTGLNRRIVWVYGSYVLAMIAGLGAFLIFYSTNVVSREPAAVAIVGFGTLFWTGRIVVDSVAFRTEDWPRGQVLAIGRTALHTLFLMLATGYLGLFGFLVI